MTVRHEWADVVPRAHGGVGRVQTAREQGHGEEIKVEEEKMPKYLSTKAEEVVQEPEGGYATRPGSLAGDDGRDASILEASTSHYEQRG